MFCFRMTLYLRRSVFFLVSEYVGMPDVGLSKGGSSVTEARIRIVAVSVAGNGGDYFGGR